MTTSTLSDSELKDRIQSTLEGLETVFNTSLSMFVEVGLLIEKQGIADTPMEALTTLTGLGTAVAASGGIMTGLYGLLVALE